MNPTNDLDGFDDFNFSDGDGDGNGDGNGVGDGLDNFGDFNFSNSDGVSDIGDFNVGDGVGDIGDFNVGDFGDIFDDNSTISSKKRKRGHDELNKLGDGEGFYHKLTVDLDDLHERDEREKKKIQKMLMVINAHGEVCQNCHIDFDSVDISKPFDIERIDGSEITIKARQGEKQIAEITTEICRAEPLTLINFPCSIDSDTLRGSRLDSPFDCTSVLDLNILLSNTTSENLDATLTNFTENIAREFQEDHTIYSNAQHKSQQTYIKENITELLSKNYSVISTNNDCNSVDLYIYDSNGTHKYTIMAPPVRISSVSPDYQDTAMVEEKYNPKVTRSFEELKEYYKFQSSIINKIISNLKQSMVFNHYFFSLPDPDDPEIINNVRFCTTRGSNLLKFMESFRFFSAPECFKKYIIDGSCFSASQKNYDDTISPRKKEKRNKVLEEATVKARGPFYGGKLTKKHSKRTKLSKQAKRTKRAKRAKRSKRAKRTYQTFSRRI